MIIAIKARTEAITPKMMVPVESEFESMLAEVVVKVVVGFMDG